MNKTVFKLNTANFGKVVMKSPQLLSVLEQEAEARSLRAGDGYKASATMGRKRALAMVYTESVEAMMDNSANNTLLKVMK